METILTDKQLVMMKTAYEFQKENKVLMLGSFPTTREGKEFLKPFIKTGMIHKDTLKFTGGFLLTEKGVSMYENITQR